MNIPKEDIEALRREKYGGAKDANMHDDLARLMKGEPLAYVIGTQPFLGLTIFLDSTPLIPRPETEWWTEILIATLRDRKNVSLLDLCAGSGAIGLSVLKHTNAHVWFGELFGEHEATIRKSLRVNALDEARADVRIGNLFEPFSGIRFDVIATNPPYIPSTRTLPDSVKMFEPHEALFAGEDGLSVIRTILEHAPLHLNPRGELWMECDMSHISEAAEIAKRHGATRTEIRNDPYGRARLLIAYY